MKSLLFKSLFIPIVIFCSSKAFSEPIPYPYPVHYFSLNADGTNLQMAYMDVKPESANGSSVILFHGKNFNGFYWEKVIKALTTAGYRVIAPDQIGWGKSAKPNMKYTFEILANNNKLLLDSLGIHQVNVIGHSMGGMLAARFSLMYPRLVTKLILEDPLGLEDYKKFIPMQTIESLYKNELKATYASYKKYQQSYYPVWKPDYEIYVKVQAEPLQQKDFASVAYVNALTWQMIYEQPVLYEFKNLSMPVLLIVGGKDRTILGKKLLNKKEQALHGNFPILAKKAAAQIKNAQVIIIPGVGHIPHIQTKEIFNTDAIKFLGKANNATD
jgi:pimeloyl-ACP methyl ester carboxylesterase